MEINPVLKKGLDKSNFLQRYRQLSEKYRDFEHRFADYQNESVIEIIKSLGYSASYNKKENFFKVVEVVDSFQFQFNISVGGGVVELIWDVKENGVRQNLAYGVWGTIATALSGGEKLKKPIFTSYDDLKIILTEAFQIYSDFKKGVLSQ